MGRSASAVEFELDPIVLLSLGVFALVPKLLRDLKNPNFLD